VRRNGAFSLLEVLLAVVILGVGIAGLAEGVTLSLRSSKEAERHTQATLLAASRLELLRAEGRLIEGEEEGDFGDEFPLYRWRETVTETETEGLYEVAVEVEIAQGEARARLSELRTLLFEMPFDLGVDSGERRGELRRRERGGPR
jgi:prepilin-type N-terminal cleavage/methylation domain-containing protein